ncbi:MAG: alkaline phosphatase D family protein [Burkholderiaceae bacterium]
MKTIVTATTLFVTLLCSVPGPLQAQSLAPRVAVNALRAGPMVGDVDMHNASVWLQTEQAGTVEVEFWPIAAGTLAAQGPAPGASRRVRVQTDTQWAPGTAIARLTNLEAGQAYGYRVWVDGRVQEPALSLRTHGRWQYRQGISAPDLRVALTSCTYVNEPARDRDGRPYGGDYDIFSAMAQAKPDLTVWLGDNVYYRENDYTSAEGMAHRWRHDRALPEMQPLLRTGRHVATWDDHDYGPNDANGSFGLKGAALEIFKRQWANRSWGLPGVPGVFGSFMESDVEFFLLDGRYHRDSDRDKDNPAKTMLGAEQLRWLKNGLLASTATFKVIVSGSQVLNDPQRFEGWHNFRSERDGFLKWLQDHQVRGVLLLSGDRHHTELLRLPRAGTYPLHELTCSPTTSGAGRNAQPEHPALHVAGTFVNQRNFCTLDVSGGRGQRVITLKSWDAKGKELWSQALREQDLR